MGFNLIARALRYILNVGLLVPVIRFSDDFSHVEPEPFAKGNGKSVQWLFDLLGWKYKDGPEDLLESSASFSPLEVTIDFSHAGWIMVENTKKRIDKIQSEISRTSVPP